MHLGKITLHTYQAATLIRTTTKTSRASKNRSRLLGRVATVASKLWNRPPQHQRDIRGKDLAKANDDSKPLLKMHKVAALLVKMEGEVVAQAALGEVATSVAPRCVRPPSAL